MANFRIINLPKVNTEIRQSFNGQITPLVYKNAVENAKPRILEHLLNVFEETEFYKGINSEISLNKKDFAAIFGLDPLTAAAALNDIKDIITSGIDLLGFVGSDGKRFSKLVNSSKIIFTFRKQEFTARVLNIPSATYESINNKGNSTAISWLDWIINGYNIPDFSILFDVTGRFAKYSRSGRAIMVRGSGGEEAEFDPRDAFLDLQAQDNDHFFVALVTSNEFLQGVSNILTREIEESASRIQGRIL